MDRLAGLGVPAPERETFVAALTMLVILGVVLAEVAAVASGVIGASRMAPTWCLQAGLLLLFAGVANLLDLEAELF